MKTYLLLQIEYIGSSTVLSASLVDSRDLSRRVRR